VPAALDRTRVDAVASGGDAEGDNGDQEEECCHDPMLPSRDYQRKWM
jgi:hypothetical protein